jgi:hypothetical protein
MTKRESACGNIRWHDNFAAFLCLRGESLVEKLIIMQERCSEVFVA